jgi:hypothetical protein
LHLQKIDGLLAGSQMVTAASTPPTVHITKHIAKISSGGQNYGIRLPRAKAGNEIIIKNPIITEDHTFVYTRNGDTIDGDSYYESGFGPIGCPGNAFFYCAEDGQWITGHFDNPT